MDFATIGASDFPSGAWEANWHPLAEGAGPRVTFAMVRLHARVAEMMCRDVPAVARRLGIDALVVDQIQLQGRAIAEHLEVPFVNVCCTVPLDGDPSGRCPPPFAFWGPSASRPIRAINRAGHAIVEQLARPVLHAGNRWRVRWGREPLRDTMESYSPLAQVCPFPREFEFPRSRPTPVFHYTGPFLDARRPQVAFPWDRLDGRPLVYASMGTLQNRLPETFQAIAAACADLPVQLVLSKGAWRGHPLAVDLPGDPVVVDYAPQLELLDRAALCVTHAGANTVLESLSRGVPIVAIPVTNDQPATAARVEWSRTGRAISLLRLTPARLREAIRRVLDDASYRTRARAMGEAMSRLGGIERAGDIVERALRTRMPVPAEA